VVGSRVTSDTSEMQVDSQTSDRGTCTISNTVHTRFDSLLAAGLTRIYNITITCVTIRSLFLREYYRIDDTGIFPHSLGLYPLLACPVPCWANVTRGGV
jgi:hypothetical protein